MKRALTVLTMLGLFVSPLVGQTHPNLSGAWERSRAESDAGLMGVPSTASVPSAVHTERGLVAARSMPLTEVLTIVDVANTVTITLPVAGRAFQRTVVPDGVGRAAIGPMNEAVQQRVAWNGDTLVVTTQQHVALPGGGDVTVDVSEAHRIDAEGRLVIETTRQASGGASVTRRAVYNRAQ